MKDDAISQPQQSIPSEETTSPDSPSVTRQPSNSARQSRIRQAASESSSPINFARPFSLRQESETAMSTARPGREASTDSDYFGHGTRSAQVSEDGADWYDRRAANASWASDRSGTSTPSTPLMVRRRGLKNDKRLTISVGAPSTKQGSSSRRAASETSSSASAAVPQMPSRPAPAARKESGRSLKVSPSSTSSGSKEGKSDVSSSLAPPPSAGIRWATGTGESARTPYTPMKRSPLADGQHSPTSPSSSPNSGPLPTTTSSSSGRSDKPLISAPRYGFNPEFQLGSATTSKKNGISKLSPTSAVGSSPKYTKDDTSPTKPSPVYSGGGGVKSMLYSNARIPATPLSPRAPIYSQRSPATFTASSGSPRNAKIPVTPRTPRTPMTPRTPRTPYGGLPSASSGGSYQGVLLTTITRGSSDPRVPTASTVAESSTATAVRRNRNRSASIATELGRFVRGGAAEVIPRLELRVLEKQRRTSRIYSLDPTQAAALAAVGNENKRLSFAPARHGSLAEKEDDDGEDSLVAQRRESDFNRSEALSKLTSKRNSASIKPALKRGSSTLSSGMANCRRERRETGATQASVQSRRSNRSGISRRTSMPSVTTMSLSERRASAVQRRLSFAPPSMRGRNNSGLNADSDDEDEDDNENDLARELNDQVHNLSEAKAWILNHRLPGDTSVMGRDIVEDNRAVSSMRRPTYAASVFQQARLIEAERQAGASSVLDLNGSTTHIPGTPMTFLPPRTPGFFFPKTPLTAFPGNNADVEAQDTTTGAENALTLAAVNAAPLPLTWKEKSLHYALGPFRFLKRQIDPKYILTMMNPKEILLPLTVRKVTLWAIYGAIIAGLVLLDHYFHWWNRLDHALHGKNLYIMGILYGFEPAMIIIIMLVARVPDARVVPDRTVLVPRGRDSMEEVSDDESQHSVSDQSDEESIAERDYANQMNSTILEEEHDEEHEQEGQQEQQQQNGSPEREQGTRETPIMLKPSMRRRSTRVTIATGYTSNSGGGGDRRGSEATTNSGNLMVPRTPGFDPRNRRSTIILHEPINLDLQLERQISRRPSGASHQLTLARTASHETRRGSYFSAVAAAAGSRLGAPSPSPAPIIVTPAAEVVDEKKDNKELIPVQTNSSAELEKGNEKTTAHTDDAAHNDEVHIEMGTSVTHPSLTESTALIIPCHNADAEVLKAVLFAALVHFEPWQIFIIDNGNTTSPPEDLEGEIRTQPMFARVNYIWLPVGNKNIAQFVGAKAAAVLNLDYVLTIDDDVIIPANFAAPMHIISEEVTAVCYPITAVDHKGDRPVFVGWQDIEYKMSALAKMAESKLCGVLFPHGAASFWKRDTMIKVLKGHDLVYFADDVKMGLQLQALGQKMGIDASISFETVAPETFLGPPVNGGANYYHQRVRSWEMARHTLYWQFSKRFLFSLNGARTPVEIGWQKFTQFYNSTTNFIDWIRLPVFILLGGSGQFWLKTFAFIFFLPIIPLIPYRFIKTRNRPDLHPHMLDMLTYGVYKLMYSVCCILGGIRSMLVFHPNHKRKPTLAEMEKSGDARCIWLRDDFMQNSGGQGDLRDEPQQIFVEEDVHVEEEEDEESQHEEEMTEAAVVTALPSQATPGAEMEQVATINVTITPSPHQEAVAPSVPEIHYSRPFSQ